MRTWAVEIAQGTRHPRPGFCPEDAGASEGYDGCYGLRSGPKAGRFGCVWHTEAAGFAAGPRQFADKRSVALLHAIDTPTLVMHLQSE
ncbi:hypothetical protein NZ708_20905 [Pseudomonas syringae pv. actinidiae ICMP 18708]|nr:hypothetical protein IYO_020925 [Pseudomonas syringae pv. actinidiae ICMP 18884]AOE58295.1 hypothetical protein NZ708_20905 [Pseudomonas syringae pv. actinidiae ICMP 18708]APP99247.1 hypothetical protein PsaNZ45_21455 [Pseudomonas syringae pv. actinidiae]APQ05008.1 hypothetical protein PsaNZ47_20895 [Pseudomonas syringae pv. actinidiae]AQX60629.1 hypothetical protein B1R35_23010 [Pseudomonas syringae pv. actinidiae]